MTGEISMTTSFIGNLRAEGKKPCVFFSKRRKKLTKFSPYQPEDLGKEKGGVDVHI